MPRHESITDEFIAELEAGFQREAQRVKEAPDWPETQKRIVTGTNAYLVAMKSAEAGATRQEIEEHLNVHEVFGALPNPIRLIGNRQIEEEEREEDEERGDEEEEREDEDEERGE